MKQLLFLLVLLPSVCFCQYRITIIIDKVPDKTTGDRIYIAGNFNQWEPADENTVLTKGSDGKFTKVIEEVPAGEYEYKFTLGSMESIEVAADGKEIANRILSLRSDTTVRLTIAGWKNGKMAFTENFTAWSNLMLPFYNSTARARKPDGAILRSRQILPKS